MEPSATPANRTVRDRRSKRSGANPPFDIVSVDRDFDAIGTMQRLGTERL